MDWECQTSVEASHFFIYSLIYDRFNHLFSRSHVRSHFRLIRTSLIAQLVKNLPPVQEMHVQSPGQEDPLEAGMATHSNIFAWRIPCTDEPGGLQPIGWQRVRHDWRDLAHMHAGTIIHQHPVETPETLCWLLTEAHRSSFYRREKVLYSTEDCSAQWKSWHSAHPGLMVRDYS